MKKLTIKIISEFSLFTLWIKRTILSDDQNKALDIHLGSSSYTSYHHSFWGSHKQRTCTVASLAFNSHKNLIEPVRLSTLIQRRDLTNNAITPPTKTNVNHMNIGNIKIDYLYSYPNFEEWIKQIKWELHMGWTNRGARTGAFIPTLKKVRQKSGIYLITNNITKKHYVGKSSNLLDRFTNYSSLKYLNTKQNSLICKALLSFGLSKFSVTIIEYTGLSKLSEREQYFINIIKPQYNIRKIVKKPSNEQLDKE